MNRLTTAALALALGAFLTAPATAQERGRPAKRRAVAEQADRSGDGRVGRIERARAKQKIKRGVRERADRNDDGRVGRVERQVAKKRIQAKRGGGGCKGKGDKARGKRGQRGGEGRGRGQGRRGGQRGGGRGRSV